jgi:hypothetical protein
MAFARSSPEYRRTVIRVHVIIVSVCMPQQLLSGALEQAERSAPVVRAAALLHIARVLNAFDHAEAARVLERGIALAEDLAEPDREVILGQAVSLAATVSPDRAIRLAPSIRDEMPCGLVMKALFDMLSHGHVAEAVRCLSDPASGPGLSV